MPKRWSGEARLEAGEARRTARDAPRAPFDDAHLLIGRAADPAMRAVRRLERLGVDVEARVGRARAVHEPRSAGFAVPPAAEGSLASAELLAGAERMPVEWAPLGRHAASAGSKRRAERPR